jgi:acyl-CoA thioester hydrolase
MRAPDPADTFHYRRQVQFAETDLAGIVHFSWYFRYMEEAEHALWRAAGLRITGDGLTWPRVAVHAEYRHPLRFEDEIDVRVRAEIGRRTIDYAFEIARGETIAAAGTMTSVCTRVDPGGGLRTVQIPAHVPERLRAALRGEG